MADGFLRLGHDGVVRSYHNNGDIRYLSTAGTHGGKGLVTRRIQECNVLTARQFHTIRANVLGDSTRLTGDDVGLADVVQK